MNNRGRLVVDVFLGVLAAILVLVLTPGLGFVAILIGVVLLISMISFAVGAAMRRHR